MIDTDTTTTRRGLLAAGTAAAATALLPAGAAQSADEEGEQGNPFGLFDGEDQGVDWSEAALAALDRVEYTVSANNPFGGVDVSATEQAQAIRTEIDDNSAAYVGYEQIPEDVTLTDTDVLKVTTSGSDDGTETFYVLGTVSDGSLTALETADSTDRTVDYELELSTYATNEVPGDLKRFRTEYVEPQTAVDNTLRSRLAAKFGGRWGGSHIAVSEVS